MRFFILSLVCFFLVSCAGEPDRFGEIVRQRGEYRQLVDRSLALIPTLDQKVATLEKEVVALENSTGKQRSEVEVQGPPNRLQAVFVQVDTSDFDEFQISELNGQESELKELEPKIMEFNGTRAKIETLKEQLKLLSQKSDKRNS